MNWIERIKITHILLTDDTMFDLVYMYNGIMYVC